MDYEKELIIVTDSNLKLFYRDTGKELNIKKYPFLDYEGELWLNDIEYFDYDEKRFPRCNRRMPTESEIKQYKLFRKLERL